LNSGQIEVLVHQVWLSNHRLKCSAEASKHRLLFQRGGNSWEFSFEKKKKNIPCEPDFVATTISEVDAANAIDVTRLGTKLQNKNLKNPSALSIAL
jgi:hypothetical protein